MNILKFIVDVSNCCLLLLQPLSAQIVKEKFIANEFLKLDVSYCLGIIKIPAGELNFQSSSRVYNNRLVAYFEATGNSYSAYDPIYKVRDRIQSFAEPEKFQPLWYENRMNQNGQEKVECYVINHDKKVIYALNSIKKEVKTDTLNFKTPFFDFLTAANNIRHINFNSFKPKDKITLNVICDNKFYLIYIKYIGNETICPFGKEYYKCLKLKISVISGDIFKEGEAITAWVTDDENRLPVQLEAKILIGSIIARLVKAENMRKLVIVKLQ